jgi:hypothetical protein
MTKTRIGLVALAAMLLVSTAAARSIRRRAPAPAPTPAPTPASDTQPVKRMLIHFNDLDLTFTPDGKTVQAGTNGMVLTYGQDWEVKVLKPFLYHLRQKNWTGFHWQVNSSRKEAAKVTGVEFGTMGGTHTPLKCTVQVVGQGNITLSFHQKSDPYLVHEPGTGTTQVAVELTVLSYGSDWEIAKVHEYLFHLRQSVWKGFYWHVNTSRKQVHESEGSNFGTIGDKTKRALPFKVDVVY